MRRAIGIACAALLLAGCGGGDDAASPESTGGQTVTVVRTPSAPDVAGGAVAGFDPKQIYAASAPGVVTIIAADGSGEGGLGSGFVISSKGDIATNAHVVTNGEGAQIAAAQRVYVRFSDGNQVEAKVIGYDPFSDVALIRVNPQGLKLRPLAFGSARGILVGAPVAAIGSPFGEEQSLSVGVVSATDRSMQSLTGFATTGVIQTDAAINHGNSGGPLLDGAGKVLGINSQIRSDSGEGSGVGFAIPADVVRRSLSQLRTSGRVRYAYLGLSSRGLYPQVAKRFGLTTAKGVWVQQVVPNSPAEQAGVRAGTKVERFQEVRWITGGDVLVGVDGASVGDDSDLSQALLAHDPGQTVTLHVIRDGTRKDIDVRLGTRPVTSSRQP